MNYTEVLMHDGKMAMYELMIWTMLFMISFLTGHKLVKVKAQIQQWLNRHKS